MFSPFGRYHRIRGWMLAAGALASGCLLLAPAAGASSRRRGSEARSRPDAAAVPAPAAEGVVVLFSGKPDEVSRNWLQLGSDRPAEWKVEDGAMVTSGGDIYSREKFSDFHLHIEFRVPYMPEAHGQERGNSGAFLQGRYEIQVLDSYGIADPGRGDCGAIYDQSAPLVNACKPPMEWQSYGIIFRAPRFDGSGNRTEPARVTILQNGVVIQNNQAISGPTGVAMDDRIDQPGPVRLQFHGNTVAYRNIWVRPLPPQGASHY